MNPYKSEISGFENSPLTSEIIDIAAKYQNGRPKNIKQIICHWVDSSEAFSKMLAQLEKELEIGIDTENHDLFSYLGFLCLLQVLFRQFL